MNGGAPKLAVALALTLVLGACSFILHYDPDGAPCNAAAACLPGYACQSGVCHADKGPCGGCAAGSRCDEGAKTCVARTCADTVCPAGSQCATDQGGAYCVGVNVGQLGSTCATDSDCLGVASDAVCLHGAVPSSSGGGTLRRGLCVQPCLPGDTCSADGTTQCWALPIWADARTDAGTVGVCLSPTLATHCTSDATCAGGVCTVFDHPLLGPITLCDAAFDGGAADGVACAGTVGSGLPLCANGLCLPTEPGVNQSAVCGRLCAADGDCGSGESCVLGEIASLATPRHVPVCAGAPTQCLDCTSDALCDVDAPHCSTAEVYPDAGIRHACLSACTPTPGEAPACPSGETCTQLLEGYRCVPAAGCP